MDPGAAIQLFHEGVAAVHSEQLVTKNGGLVLESLDAWVDPSTRGARLIGRASLQHVQVSGATSGLKVYAARDERDGRTKFVQLVVTGVTTRTDTVQPMHPSGLVRERVSDCGHARAALSRGARGDSALMLVGIRLESQVIRDMQISFSISETARDREPVVSVSYGWSRRAIVRGPPE